MAPTQAWEAESQATGVEKATSAISAMALASSIFLPRPNRKRTVPWENSDRLSFRSVISRSTVE